MVRRSRRRQKWRDCSLRRTGNADEVGKRSTVGIQLVRVLLHLVLVLCPLEDIHPGSGISSGSVISPAAKPTDRYWCLW